jgi:hypothetical protein
MNGVIVLSTRSGACLFAQSYQEDFGLPRGQFPGTGNSSGNSGGAGRNGNGAGGGATASSPEALQLAALLFALDLHAGEVMPGASGGNGGNGGGGGGSGVGPGRYCSPRHVKYDAMHSRNKASTSVSMTRRATSAWPWDGGVHAADDGRSGGGGSGTGTGGGGGGGAASELKRWAVGRGLHSVPFPLNLSLLCPSPPNLSLLCPPYNPN